MFDLLLRNAAVATMQDGSPFGLVPKEGRTFADVESEVSAAVKARQGAI